MNLDVQKIHDASIAILENPGIKLEHDGICDLLIKAGAKPGSASNTVRLPRQMIEDILKRAPATVSLGSRRPGQDHAITCDSAPLVWSVPGMNLHKNKAIRPFQTGDMADMAALLDALPHVDGVFGMAMSDAAPRKSDVTGLRIMAENTTKHIRVLCFTPEGMAVLRRMFDAFDGNWFSIGFTSHGPLRWTNLALRIFESSAGSGIPTTINGEPMAGVTGPVTIAGSAAVANAEILTGIIVNQLLEPGRPCIYNMGLAHVFDMKTAIVVTGGPENHLFAAISAAMGRFYKIPSCSWVSTESMNADAQAGLEKAMGYFTHMQNGVNVIWGAGQLESEMTLSPAQAVIDNDIIGYTKRLLRGVEVTDASLAIDLIRKTGISGSFLETDHTMENFRSEIWEPSILCRNKREVWAAGGHQDLAEAAERQAEQLIARQKSNSDSLRPSCAPLRELEREFLGQ